LQRLTVVAETRASWKGYLKIAELTCPVALYTAVSSSERIALHAVNRATGHRLRRQFIDSATGALVERDDQVKGYELGDNAYITLEPEEVAAAVPAGDKTLSVSAFVDETEIDALYFDRPYYLAPADQSADESFALIRRGLFDSKTVAIADAVLFRRARTLAIRPYEAGLAAVTLHFDYEVRPASEAFADVPDLKIKGEMLELAEHIIATKRGDLDPRAFRDRYEDALAALVKAKLEGRRIEPPKRAKPTAPTDLMAALRQSAKLGGKSSAPKSPSPSAAKAARPGARRKAG
jgi:DNA end-binding protein Ku